MNGVVLNVKFFRCLIFQIIVLNFGFVMKEIVKNLFLVVDDKNVVFVKGKGKGGKDDKKDSVKEKFKRKGLLDILFIILDEWVQFDIFDEVSVFKCIR